MARAGRRGYHDLCMAPVSRKVPPACNRELPRILIPRTRVNKGMKEGRGLGQPRPSARDALAYREEPHLLLGEGVARQVLCPHAHNGLVDTATLQVGARV